MTVPKLTIEIKPEPIPSLEDIKAEFNDFIGRPKNLWTYWAIQELARKHNAVVWFD